ncbi:MAG: ABC transporter ATP-binding protein [Trueperaceae bacterium]|nr:ABC transporter ATP-binding protein [Trueperaceae bacterium]
MSAGLDVRGLTVRYGDAQHGVEVVRDVDLRVAPGQTVGLVGESGSGKSTLALAVLRALPGNGALAAGTITLGGDDVLAMDADTLRRFWGRRVALVPQNPLPSMNPALTIGRQLAEALEPDAPRHADRDAINAMLDRVGLPDPPRVRAAYPFELSGGQQQRVMIAMALLTQPELLVMDEPTTNLDVTTEAAILNLVRDLVRDVGAAVLYVSHSLGVVAQLCDRVDVLYAGELVESAPVRDLYRAPRHPYTLGLLDGLPRLGRRKTDAPLRPIPGRIPAPEALPPGCVFAPRCPAAEDACRQARPPLEEAGEGRRVACRRWREIADGEASARQRPGVDPGSRKPSGGVALRTEGAEKRFPLRRGLAERLRGRPRRSVHALQGVDVTVRRGRTLGLVGESGSGKSTLARAVIGLGPLSEGRMELLNVPLARRLERRDVSVIRQLQMVFQSSDEALNPHRTVGSTLRRPFMRLAGLARSEADHRVAALLGSVQLPAEFAARTPDQLSGGEKQRVAVARAFASDPELILFDESISGLDVSVQAAVLNLLAELQVDRRTSYLFISHDLAVVAHLADDVTVMYLGQVMESGTTDEVLAPPYHPYTEVLLASVPRADPDVPSDTVPVRGEVPSPLEAPRGCPFATRCPRVLGDVCWEEPPPERHPSEGHRIRCHIPVDELRAAQDAQLSEADR